MDRDKIEKIIVEVLCGHSIEKAVDKILKLHSNHSYTIEDIERCVENWGICKVEREYIEKFLNKNNNE